MDDLSDLKFPVDGLLTVIEQLMQMLILHQSSENIWELLFLRICTFMVISDSAENIDLLCLLGYFLKAYI